MRTAAFPRRDTLFPLPKPIALHPLLILPPVACEAAAAWQLCGQLGTCPGLPARAQAPCTLPCIPGNRPKNILVFSKDIYIYIYIQIYPFPPHPPVMFWILSSSLCELRLEELQATQKTKQCNNSKNTVHLRVNKGSRTHSLREGTRPFLSKQNRFPPASASLLCNKV